MNKKEEKRNLDEQLRTMPKPNLKSEQKHRIQLAINEANTEQRSKRPISIMLAFTALFIFSLLIFTSINKYTDLASGDIRSDILLDNVIAKDKDEYQFEQIPWFTTK